MTFFCVVDPEWFFSDPNPTLLFSWFRILCEFFLIFLKVLSHQIRSAWKWFGWIGLVEYKDRGCLKDVLILPPFANLNFNSSSGIAKHDRCCMQFADSAGKFACGAQFCTCKDLQPCFTHIWKLILYQQFKMSKSNPEITFVKKVCLLFKTHCKG